MIENLIGKEVYFTFAGSEYIGVCISEKEINGVEYYSCKSEGRIYPIKKSLVKLY